MGRARRRADTASPCDPCRAGAGAHAGLCGPDRRHRGTWGAARPGYLRLGRVLRRRASRRGCGDRCGEHALAERTSAIAFVRPPGHHAEQDRAMGFCLFNNVAVAAASARAAGLDRVAVLDYDVHHGNGTQWMFYDDPSVLYVSLHQYPFYPGTGALTDVGRGDGLGFTLNVPLEAGAGDADYDRAMQELVGPVVAAFAPELILLSAGYDAHDRDPLGGMRLSTDGYGAMTAHVQRLAASCCDRRMAAVTEGGVRPEGPGCLSRVHADTAGGRAAHVRGIRDRRQQSDRSGHSGRAAGPQSVLARGVRLAARDDRQPRRVPSHPSRTTGDTAWRLLAIIRPGPRRFLRIQ